MRQTRQLPADIQQQRDRGRAAWYIVTTSNPFPVTLAKGVTPDFVPLPRPKWNKIGGNTLFPKDEKSTTWVDAVTDSPVALGIMLGRIRLGFTRPFPIRVSLKLIDQAGGDDSRR